MRCRSGQRSSVVGGRHQANALPSIHCRGQMIGAERVYRFLLKSHKVAFPGDKGIGYCYHHGRTMVLGRGTRQTNGRPRRIKRSARQIACGDVKISMGEGHVQLSMAHRSSSLKQPKTRDRVHLSSDKDNNLSAPSGKTPGGQVYAANPDSVMRTSCQPSRLSSTSGTSQARCSIADVIAARFPARTNLNVEPCPGSDCTEIRPPCRSTIFLQMANPIPVPENSSRLCRR
jgi:hypothetical protein